jgi:hypothetical protein
MQEIEIIEMDDKEAKEKILAFIKDNPDKDAFDIHLELRLDMDQIFKLCDELIKENKIQWCPNP